jgi:hypothetical protein
MSRVHHWCGCGLATCWAEAAGSDSTLAQLLADTPLLWAVLACVCSFSEVVVVASTCRGALSSLCFVFLATQVLHSC